MSKEKRCRCCGTKNLGIKPYCGECMKVEIGYFGSYRMGLTNEEIIEYLKRRANTLNIKRLFKKFCDIAGVNTVAVGPEGQSLMYRHDVERFADKLFLEKETYFD